MVSQRAGQRRVVAVPAARGRVEENLACGLGEKNDVERVGAAKRGQGGGFMADRGEGKGGGKRGTAWSWGRRGGQAADSGVGAVVGGVVREQERALGPIREEGSRRVGRCFGPVQNELGIFYLLNIFFTNSKFKCFKECLPLVENFQIKFGFIRN
jgi:hypothetical protein